MENKNIDIDFFEKRFRQRYLLKKCINMLANAFIVFSGISSILYSVFVLGSNLIDRLRYMTFDGTIFTTIVCMIFVVVSVYEAVHETELTYRNVYFLRLSSATTEFVIFIVVMFGFLPIVPDDPDIVTYTGFNMHIVIPIVTLLSFIFNDAPIGKIKVWEPFHGTWFITCYAIISAILFGTGILPSSKAPYSFLDFKNSSIFFCLACLVGIYIVGYSISYLMIMLNRYLSWIWFADLQKYRNNRKAIQANKKDKNGAVKNTQQ